MRMTRYHARCFDKRAFAARGRGKEGAVYGRLQQEDKAARYRSRSQRHMLEMRVVIVATPGAVGTVVRAEMCR